MQSVQPMNFVNCETRVLSNVVLACARTVRFAPVCWDLQAARVVLEAVCLGPLLVDALHWDSAEVRAAFAQ